MDSSPPSIHSSRSGPTSGASNWVAANPFNTLGLLAGISEKELAQRKAKINAYLNVGKALHFPEDLPADIAGTVRTPEMVSFGFSALDNYSKRALHGLFWFCDGGHVDGPALAHLRAGDVEKAKNIWGRVITAGPLTGQTLSSATNHGALCFLEAGVRNDSAAALYLEGLGSYLKAFAHEGFPAHVARIADETVAKDLSDLLGNWVVQFRKGVAGSIKVDEVFLVKVGAAIKSLPEGQREVFTRAFTEEHAAEVEKLVSTCAAKRKAALAKALEPGTMLLGQAVPHLRSLKALLGADNMEYQHASDLVAEELLQCAIEHYNLNDEKGQVDWPRLRALLAGVVAHAQGHRLKARVNENKKTLDENYENREERQQMKKAQPLLAQLQNALQSADRPKESSVGPFHQKIAFQFLDDWDLVKAEVLLAFCAPLLKELSVGLGVSNQLYLNVSSAIANKALQLVISSFNDNSGKASFNRSQIPAFIDRSVKILDRVKALDMVADLRKQLDANYKTMKGISSKVRSASRSNNSGCMVTFVAIGVIVTLVCQFIN